ncbi:MULTISPECIES: hypothetical protein [unclassified Methylobacterium]|uniref:hypothetical protein n=1 Tax=unclassified Methylobacterium TaxID=2615210 RepID=UPI001FEF7D7C|nr:MULTISPECIES: hypothetical protein [unclassified Methylobacterium]
MPRILLVAQETAGVGKSTVTCGLAEAVPDATILEIDSTHRLTEFPSLVAEAGAAGKGRFAKGQSGDAQTGGVRHLPMRATREAGPDRVTV